MKIRIKRMEIPEGSRILVTSDIHGHAALLQRLLGKAGFSSRDMLFILGDMIEKGPESLKTLRCVMGLAELENVTALIGNVDLSRVEMLERLGPENCQDFFDYLVEMREWKGGSIYDDMAAELGLALENPERVLEAKSPLLAAFGRELDFIRTLPAVVETRNFIFVHAGLPCQDLEELGERDIYEVLKVDGFMKRGLSFEKYVVAGHWPVSIYDEKICRTSPVTDREHHIISIDGGCGLHMEGQLNMLIIPREDCEISRISHVFCDEFERFEALEDQRETTDSVNISFSNRRVKVLEAGEEFSLVEHLSSGQRIRVLSERIYNREGECADAFGTDYLLPVKAGEELALVKRTSRGYLMKKNGICGWYKGELKDAQ